MAHVSAEQLNQVARRCAGDTLQFVQVDDVIEVLWEGRPSVLLIPARAGEERSDILQYGKPQAPIFKVYELTEYAPWMLRWPDQGLHRHGLVYRQAYTVPAENGAQVFGQVMTTLADLAADD